MRAAMELSNLLPYRTLSAGQPLSTYSPARSLVGILQRHVESICYLRHIARDPSSRLYGITLLFLGRFLSCH